MRNNNLEIKPCKDDLISVLAVWPVIIICEIIIAVTSSFNQHFIGGMLLLNGVLCISSMRDFVYLSRRIQIDREGCTFSIWGYSKKYDWNSLNVQLCEDRSYKFNDSDVSGPGILIGAKAMRYTGKIAPMTYCRYWHPFSSVYIRYSTPKEETKGVAGKIVYCGYTKDKDVLLDCLASVGISNAGRLHESEDI